MDTPRIPYRLPNELLILIANKSTPSTLVKLMMTSKHFFLLCSPIIHGKAMVDPYYTAAALFWVAATGDKKLASRLLSNPGSVEVIEVTQPRTYSRHELDLDRFNVVSRDSIEGLVTFVLKQGAHLFIRESRRSPYTSSITWAAKNNHMGLLRLVLRKGIDVNDPNHLRQTPLHIALRNGNENMVKCLLTEFSADVNAFDGKSKTPLILALQNRILPHGIVELLLRLGACPQYKLSGSRYEGWRPLHIAASMCDEAAVRSILSYGADPNAASTKSGTPLHIAAAEKSGGDIVRLLLEANSDPAAEDWYSKTPFELAEISGNSAVGELLCALWNSGVSRPLPDGRTLTHLAARHSQWGLLAQLLDMKCDINTKDKAAQSPLHAAATSYCDAAAIALVDAGAELDCIDETGRTPLHIAATVPGLAVYKTLLKLGSKCILKRDLANRTAVHIAAWTMEYPGCTWGGDGRGRFDGHERRAMAKKVEERERELLKEVCDVKAGLGGYWLGKY